MKRRDFIKTMGTGASFISLLLSGCGFALHNKTGAATASPAVNKNYEGGTNMKITVITRSPHKNGTSALLADNFIEGVRKNLAHILYDFFACPPSRHISRAIQNVSHMPPAA